MHRQEPHPNARSRLPGWAVRDFSAYFCSNSFFTFSRNAKGICRPNLQNTPRGVRHQAGRPPDILELAPELAHQSFLHWKQSRSAGHT